MELSLYERWKVSAVAKIVLDAIEMDQIRTWMVRMFMDVAHRSFGYYDFPSTQALLWDIVSDRAVLSVQVWRS